MNLPPGPTQLQIDIQQHHLQSNDDKHQRKDASWIKTFLVYQWFIYMVAVLAFSYGQPQSLKAPFDPDNQACGVDVAVQSFPYIYFVTPNEKYLYRTVCVSECPLLRKGQSSQDQTLTLQCSPNSVVTSCENHPSNDFIQYQVSIYDTVRYRNVCLPLQLNYLQLILPASIQPSVSSHIYDFISARYVILFSLLICLLFNSSLLKYLHKYTKGVVYTVIGILYFSIGALTILGFRYALQFNSLSKLENQKPNTILDHEQVIFQAQARSVSIFLVLFISIILACLFVVMPLASFFYWNRLQRMITNLKIAAQFLSSLGSDLHFVPILASGLLTINYILWFAISVYILSWGSVKTEKNELPYDQFYNNPAAVTLIVFHIFELILTVTTVIGAAQYIHLSAFILCYEHKMTNYNQNPMNPLISPIQNKQVQYDPTLSYLQLAREKFFYFHVGTVILGELLITSVTPVRWIFTLFRQFRQKLNGYSQRAGSLCCNMKFYNCMNKCYEEQVGTIEQDAYMFNEDFLTSCPLSHKWKEGFYDELQEFGAMGKTFTTICQLTVSLFNSLIVFILLTQTKINVQISSPATTTLLAFFFSYTTTYLFASVYGSCIDTLYLLMKRDSIRSDLRSGVNASQVSNCNIQDFAINIGQIGLNRTNFQVIKINSDLKNIQIFNIKKDNKN